MAIAYISKKTQAFLLFPILALWGCPPQSSSKDAQNSTVITTATNTKTSTNPAPSTDPLNQYCQLVKDVKIKTSISDELAFFCSSSGATPRFRELYKQAASQDPKNPSMLEQAEEGMDGYSKITLVWSFVVPSVVAELRKSPLTESLTASYTSSQLKQTGTASPLESNDHPLHLKSASLSYEVKITTQTGAELTNSRKTQFDLYQLQTGNEDLGLAVEFLSDTNNPDYRRATMVNLALNTDGEKAVIVTILNYSIANKGLHSVALATIKEIGKSASAAFYSALSNP